MVPVPPSVQLTESGLILGVVWATVTAIVPLTDPDVAVIVAVPLATEVMSPADDTVAALVFDELQVTVAPDMAVPPESFTVGTNVTVSPTDVNVFDVGERVTLDAACPTVIDAVLVADPEVAVMVAVPLATEVTSPADDTVA